jgi:transcriptional regulator with XRE-family HTH domain
VYVFFAFAKNLGRSQYGKYEAGKTSITSNVLKRVIDALGVTVSEFFSEGFDD